ncbi:MAG: alpha/beta fold hydrolase [Syntrophomonas sp.]
MKCQLVSVETEDQVVLHGAFFEGDPYKPAVLILHGAAMNFYTGIGRFMPEILSPPGYACLNANHRGHDFGTAPDSDKKPVLGLMRERFGDCEYDLKAWIKHLQQYGFSKIVLLGHSQAIPKILYAQNRNQFPGIAGLVLISPPPSVSKMMRFLVGDNFYERGLFKARELAELGMDDQLIVLKGRGTMPWIFTPGTFLSFYGPDTPADTVELIGKIWCPVLLIRGSRDCKPVSRQLLNDMKQNAGSQADCSIVEIKGADHFYSQHEFELGEAVLEWLENIALNRGSR